MSNFTRFCAVPNCKNRSDKQHDIPYYNFPKDDSASLSSLLTCAFRKGVLKQPTKRRILILSVQTTNVYIILNNGCFPFSTDLLFYAR